MELSYYAIPGMQKRRPTVHSVEQAVCDAFGVPYTFFQQRTNSPRHVEVRQMIWKILSDLGHGASGIGKLYDYNHATVIWGKKSITNKIDTEDEMRRKYQLITTKLNIQT